MAKTYKGINIVFGADTSSIGKALKDIDNQAKNTKSELNEINKALKFDPKDSDLLAKKFDTLQTSINSSSERLKFLKSVQSQVEEQFKNGSIGTDQYESFRSEIIKTESQLKSLKSQSEETGKAITANLTSAINTLGGDIKTAVTSITAISAALAGVTTQGARFADDINTMSKVTGLSTEELQKFNYASALVDVSVDTLAGSLKKLTNNMDSARSGSGTEFEAFKRLKVDVTDSNGALRDAQSVFDECINALGKMQNETERNATAMDIFGKSAEELNPLILSGADALNEMYQAAEDKGLIFSQETLDNLNTFSDKIDIAKQEFQGMSAIVANQLVDSFDSAFESVDNLLVLVQQSDKDGTLKNIADGAAISLKALVAILSSVIKFIYEYRVAIAAGASAMAAFKIAMDISKTIQTAVVAYKALSSALQAANVAQLALNTSMDVNPVILAVSAISSLVVGLGSYAAISKTAAKNTEDFSSKTYEVKSAIDELTESIDSSKQSREKNIAEIESEYGGYKQLADQLFTLAESENQTAESKNTMLTLINQLNDKIPDLNLNYSETTHQLSMQREEVEKLIDKTMTYYKLQAAQDTLSDIGKQQFDVEQQLAELEKKKSEASINYNSARNTYNPMISSLSGSRNPQAVAQMGQYKAKIDEAKKAFDSLVEEYDTLTAKQTELQAEFDSTTKYINDNTASVSDLSVAQKNVLENTSEEIDKLQESKTAYDNYSTAISNAKSQISELTSMLDKLNSGTEYSTLQILDLIEKYPELTSSIIETENGYTIEQEAVKKLIELRVQNLKLMAEEQVMSAKQIAMANGVADATMEILTAGIDNGSLSDITDFARNNYKDTGLYEYLQAYQYANGIDSIVDDILKNGFKSGVSGSTSINSSVLTYNDTTDYFKQAAENEIAQAEHLYKIGELSAEEYYNKLDDINKRYYANKSEYLEEYQKLEETVYSGLKKTQEDNIKNALDLYEKTQDVIKAQNNLDKANNTKVRVYSASRGWTIQTDSETQKKAMDSLYEAQKALLLKQMDIGNFSNTELQQMLNNLPNISKLTIPNVGSTTNNTNNTSNNSNSTNNYYQWTFTGNEIKSNNYNEFKSYMDRYIRECNMNLTVGKKK